MRGMRGGEAMGAPAFPLRAARWQARCGAVDGGHGCVKAVSEDGAESFSLPHCPGTTHGGLGGSCAADATVVNGIP